MLEIQLSIIIIIIIVIGVVVADRRRKGEKAKLVTMGPRRTRTV